MSPDWRVKVASPLTGNGEIPGEDVAAATLPHLPRRMSMGPVAIHIPRRQPPSCPISEGHSQPMTRLVPRFGELDPPNLGYAGVALEHNQGVMRQHLSALVKIVRAHFPASSQRRQCLRMTMKTAGASV